MTVTRRRFVSAGVAGALALSGCGARHEPREPSSDTAVLRALSRSHRAAAGVVIGSRVADQVARDDARSGRRLARLAGVAAAAPQPAEQTLHAALSSKQKLLFDAVAALPRLGDSEHRVAVLALVSEQAAQIVALREAAGREPAPDAFAGFAPT